MKLNNFNIICIKKQFIITLVMLSVFGYNAFAGIERMSTRLTGSQIATGQSFVVIDNKYPNVDLGGTSYVNYSIGKVSLGIDYTMPNLNYDLSSYNYDNYYVILKVTYELSDLSSHTVYETLKLNYTHLQAKTIDKSFAIIKGAHLMSVVIDHFEQDQNQSRVIVASPAIPSNLYLEAEIETERFYPLTINTPPVINHNYLTSSNELEVYWNTVTGAEEYELEWTYVNAYDGASVPYNYELNSTSNILPNLAIEYLKFTFLHNATKIRTSKNSFRIGLNYNAGLLIYRIRAIGKDFSNINDINYETVSKWSTEQSPLNESISIDANLGGTGSFSDYYEIIANNSHEENKNWQYTATYAEDGKKKEVVSYFDGSFRNRQTVTKTNTVDVSIVAETIYDRQGRGAVQILPTPTSTYLNIVKYFENFNQSNSGLHLPYSKVDIEATGNSCPNSPDPLYTDPGAEGASVYYSAFNIKNRDNQHAFIPDAEKYPFTTTVFTPDNTGRVKRQSGVGAAHKIGTDHETVYLYGDPDQEDLDKLFGSEAGYAERYKKNFVVDPNGQISVSYLNTENKVVATALAGNSPSNVTSINSSSSLPTSVSYFDHNDDNYDQINKPNGNSITFSKKIIPTVTGTYTFTYNLLVPKYTNTCIPLYCYDCVYKLDIILQDECGAVKYSNSQPVGFASGSTSQVDFTCNTNPIEYSTNGIVPPFDAVLQAGKEYFLSKTLLINDDAMMQYLDHYMDTIAKNNDCLKTIKNFTASPTATVSSLGCGMTCTACAVQVTSKYNAQHAVGSTVPTDERMTEFERDAAIKECMRPCNEVNLCEVQFENLLQDVRPNGQYAEYKVVAGVVDASGSELSIFNTNNKLPLTNMSCRPNNNTSYTAFSITYDIAIASYKNPEYYNLKEFDFEQPIIPSSNTKYHYFNTDGTLGKIRLIVHPTISGNYLPKVTNTSLVYTDNIGLWTYPENLDEVTDFVTNYISHPEWALSLVKYHPEFNYYLDCSRQTNPDFYITNVNPTTNCKKFDSLLMYMDTYSAADAVFNFNSLSYANKNDSYDLLNADPYFALGAPGYPLRIAFQNKLTSYAPKPGGSGFMTAKEVAASMFSTANMYYSTCTGVFGETTVLCSSGNLTVLTPAKNNMWKAYRNIYLAEKNKIITAASHTNAVSTGVQSNYFNGAIGDPNFNEWDAYHNYQFLPYFPFGLFFNSPAGFLNMIKTKFDPSFYPNCTAGGGNPNLYYPSMIRGFHDFGSPSSFYHKDKYAHKSRRFVDEQSLNNGLAGGATDPETVMKNLINYANNEIQLNSSECPIYKRLELFLTSTFNNTNLVTTGVYHPLVDEASFTRDLYDKLALCASLTPTATWYPNLEYKTSIDPSTKVLTIEFYKTVSGTRIHINTADINLSPPSSSFVWADLKIVSSIHFAGTTGNTDNFTIMGAYIDHSINPSNTFPTNITLTGTSDCLKSDCAPPVVFNCKPTQQALELQQFLNSVAGDYKRTSPSVTFPLDLSDPNNYTSQNFSALVRYPFGNTAVAATTHAVNFLPSSNQIVLYGSNSSITPNPNITVTFAFTDPTGTGNNLTNIVGFTGLTPKQSPTDPYDFTIRAIYGTSGSLVYKTFRVNISYPSTVCGNTPDKSCQIYNLTNCDVNVSSTCSNSDEYQAGMDLYHFMQEAFQQSETATTKALNTFANYTGLLKTQIGASADNLVASIAKNAYTWTYDSGKNLSTTENIIYNFVNTTTSPQYTTCAINFSIAIKGDISSGNINGGIGGFADFKVLDPNTGVFQFNMLTNNGNDFIITGKAPCLNIVNCEPCPIKDTLLFENFDSYNATNVTLASDLPFTTSYTDMNSNVWDIPFAGMNVCNIYSTSTAKQFTILSDADALCLGVKKAYDHTKVNPVRNFLSVYAGSIKNPLVPYKKTLTTLEVGKQYEFSVYIRLNVDGPTSFTNKKINLEVNGGNSDVIIASTIYDTHAINIDNKSTWYRVSGFFTATNSTTTLKIKLYQNGSSSIQTIRFFIDDITLRTKQCETPPLFIPPVNTSTINPCFSNMANIQTANAQQEMVYYLNDMKNEFIKNYKAKCLQTIESMQAGFFNSEGHYTLYYYDQAGNLIKTVPPEGVETLTLTNTFPGGILSYGKKIKNDRANHTKTVFTQHRLATKYEYNSLNQLIRQNLPDHAATEQWDTPVNTNLPVNLQTTSMDFSDSQHGYMAANIGSTGYIYDTQDGGKTWSPISALGLSDLIDFEVNGTTAYVITSDGNLLTSTNFSSTNPVWSMANILVSNSLPFLDIEFIDANNGLIIGTNGLILETTNGGGSWGVVTLPTTPSGRLTKVTHKDDGSGGIYIVLTGEGGEIYYKTPGSLFTKFYGINSGIDISDCSILSTGNAAPSFLEIVVCGQDKTGTVHKANSILLKNINSTDLVNYPMTIVPFNLTSLGVSATTHSKFSTLVTDKYTSGSSTNTEIYLGGVTESTPPKPLLVKLTSNGNTIIYTGVNINPPLTVSEGISKLAIITPNGVASSSVFGSLNNGQLLKHDASLAVTTVQSLNTTGSLVNSTPLNSIWLNQTNSDGYVVGNHGTIIAFDQTGATPSHAINTVSFSKLNAVTAAKDGSGKVYVVGDGGTIIHSLNNGGLWQALPSSLTNNLSSALYISGSNPKLVLAGPNSYIGELDILGNLFSQVTVPSSSTNYKMIKQSNVNNTIFVVGDDAGSAVISRYTLGTIALLATPSVPAGISTINDIGFTSPNIAYAVGYGVSGGKIIKSINNGSTFTNQTSGTSNSLNSVIVSDQLTAYTFGNNSTILKTTDGGLNWVTKTIPAGSGTSVNSVYNLGNNNIIASGIGSPSLFNVYDKGDDYSSRFYYDALGRLIISQNSKQYNKTNRSYSYTIYDPLGRIAEVGEISGAGLPEPDYKQTANGIIDISVYNNWLTLGSKSEVTSTKYDSPVSSSCGFTQDNLRKRVSATYLDSDGDLANSYQYATLYTYDIHGNVKSLLNENPNLPAGHTCKKIDYSYDLISGKVNTVSYQKGSPDEFYHKYEYDADNRITNVYTSKEGHIWEQDAKYFYYLHGPLARTEIGNEKIQGMDYAYTLQGWIKGINSGNLEQTNDIGKDGNAGTLYNQNLAGLNKFISNDAASYSLNYYGNDYKSINDAYVMPADRFYASAASVPEVTNTNNWLYNGNISSMATTIINQVPSTVIQPQLMTYKYDQLNRILNANAYAGIVNNVWTPTSATDSYNNAFSYDANGNIKTQIKYSAAGVKIEDLTYNYHTDGANKKLSNRLYHVNDAVSTPLINDDIEDQGAFTPAPNTGNLLGQVNSANNYSYDEIGNLVKDESEGIQNIEWNVYGKIAKIERTNGFYKPLPLGGKDYLNDLEFLYDPSGNRVAKIVKPRDANGQKQQLFWTYTYYVRDAQGNVMATYEKLNNNFSLTEHNLYGSSRLGVQAYFEPSNVGPTSRFETSSVDYVQWRSAGDRKYELSNHLGNVLSVVSDLKIPVGTSTDQFTIDHFEPNIISATDYYPFGSPMSGRSFNAPGYKYGFNGQEKDDEVLQGAMTAEYWEYDSRLGRRWNIDPVFDPTTSPYACFSDNPILLSDPNGDTPGEPKSGKTNVTNEPLIKAKENVDVLVKVDRPLSPSDATATKPSIYLPKNQSTTSKQLDVYSKDASVKWKGSDKLLAASSGNTQNVARAVSNGEPARNAGIEFPGTTIGVGYGAVSVNTDGEVSLSKEVGPFGVGTGGVDYNGYSPGSKNTDTKYSTYLVVDGTAILKKVDIADVSTISSSCFLTGNSIQRYKSETYANGSATGYSLTVDSSSFNANFEYSSKTNPWSASFSTPILKTNNLPKPKRGTAAFFNN